MIWPILLLAYIELYSVAMAFYARGRGDERWLWNLVPFTAYFFVDRYGKGFKMLTVPVKKWGRTVLILLGISALFCLWAMWGKNTLSETESGFLKEIAYLPVGACAFLFWLGTANGTTKVLLEGGTDFKGLWLCNALLLPAPVLLALSARRRIRENEEDVP